PSSGPPHSPHCHPAPSSAAPPPRRPAARLLARPPLTGDPPGLSPSRAGRETAMTAAVAGADDERKAQALVRDDAPKLLAALKEMKDGLDLVRSKVESLTRRPSTTCC
uniref:Uncharacterized protein n=1 Tax=Aegilops tauschii subsp. strangulata TaxID=200361 RepID=A0A453LAH8_AEGTS